MIAKICRILILLVLVSGVPAFSQTTPQGQSSGQPKRQAINFEDQLVKGELKRPELFQILQRRQFNFGRLIKLRENFTPEMRRTGEEIQRGGD
jgi:hypothetical protein